MVGDPSSAIACLATPHEQPTTASADRCARRAKNRRPPVTPSADGMPPNRAIRSEPGTASWVTTCGYQLKHSTGSSAGIISRARRTTLSRSPLPRLPNTTVRAARRRRRSRLAPAWPRHERPSRVGRSPLPMNAACFSLPPWPREFVTSVILLRRHQQSPQRRHEQGERRGPREGVERANVDQPRDQHATHAPEPAAHCESAIPARGHGRPSARTQAETGPPDRRKLTYSFSVLENRNPWAKTSSRYVPNP